MSGAEARCTSFFRFVDMHCRHLSENLFCVLSLRSLLRPCAAIPLCVCPSAVAFELYRKIRELGTERQSEALESQSHRLNRKKYVTNRSSTEGLETFRDMQEFLV
ncbi:hypothetical protein BDV27DRAFT_48291 [Aspergillus caelatus]|uniref:Uncharacterized protein n=1 Tax=Aspergillus caelatus TaxID=61420 RepID=A0A5N7AEP9_9EURO|nr:uncharacterized protein BDV27DRAFT_48291 [Aspergillus caelatus]KAE8368312.1 hypothetical protein BDV27DRAFT_48291 [Aspergillus caelatus]